MYTGHRKFEDFKDDESMMFPAAKRYTGELHDGMTIFKPYAKCIDPAPRWTREEMDMLDEAFRRTGFVLKKKYLKKNYK